LQQYDKALADLCKAIELHPKYAPAWYNRGTVYQKLGRYQAAIDDYDNMIRRFPQLAVPYNDLAWVLATCSDAKFRDPARAVELARRAVDLIPQQGGFWNTLGVARFRVGAHQAALDALQKSIDLRRGGDACDYLFVSMSHWRLDHKDQARNWYEKGVQWIEKNGELMDKHEQYAEELKRFRVEAQEMLKINE
ncbi:MAG: tetratricopeptide repeat protein, partial [Deltaproteobacteria bacterium]